MKKILAALGEAKLWQECGLDVIASSPAEFAVRLVNEQKKRGDVIGKLVIKPEQAKPGDDAATLLVTDVAAISLAVTALRC